MVEIPATMRYTARGFMHDYEVNMRVSPLFDGLNSGDKFLSRYALLEYLLATANTINRSSWESSQAIYPQFHEAYLGFKSREKVEIDDAKRIVEKCLSTAQEIAKKTMKPINHEVGEEAEEVELTLKWE